MSDTIDWSQKLQAFLADTAREIPGFRIAEKRTSRLMKALYYVSFMFLWNRSFMTDYTTTVGRVVYVPNVAAFEANAFNTYVLLRHETQHIRDSIWLATKLRSRVLGTLAWFGAYFAPQVFALLAVNAIWGSLWWLCALAFAAPWPAPGRVLIEFRGYAETLRAMHEGGPVLDTDVAWYARVFTSWGYYRMAWRLAPIQKRLSDVAFGDTSPNHHEGTSG